MSTITREQLIEDLKASEQNASGMFEISEETICALMSMLTNAAQQLPQPAVTECYQRLLKHAYGMTMGHDWNKGTMAGHHREKLCKAVEDCRAAMLQGCKSPVAQDGWQLVPKEPTEEMNKAGWAAMNKYDAINPTYRAMLAAAPQQDVKLALEIGMSRYAGVMQKLADAGD